MVKLLIWVQIIYLFIGCKVFQPEGINHDPLPLISPETVVATDGAVVQTFQLQCQNNPDNLCLYDEDGDHVSVVMDENSSLPAIIVLDETTGILTVTRTASFKGSAVFWTDDGQGGSTELDPLKVSFIVTDAASDGMMP